MSTGFEIEPEVDYFAILGIPRSWDWQTVRRAARLRMQGDKKRRIVANQNVGVRGGLAFTHHPEAIQRETGRPATQDELDTWVKLSNAYTILTKAKLFKQYRHLAAGITRSENSKNDPLTNVLSGVAKGMPTHGVRTYLDALDDAMFRLKRKGLNSTEARMRALYVARREVGHRFDGVARSILATNPVYIAANRKDKAVLIASLVDRLLGELSLQAISMTDKTETGDRPRAPREYTATDMNPFGLKEDEGLESYSEQDEFDDGSPDGMGPICRDSEGIFFCHINRLQAIGTHADATIELFNDAVAWVAQHTAELAAQRSNDEKRAKAAIQEYPGANHDERVIITAAQKWWLTRLGYDDPEVDNLYSLVGRDPTLVERVSKRVNYDPNVLRALSIVSQSSTYEQAARLIKEAFLPQLPPVDSPEWAETPWMAELHEHLAHAQLGPAYCAAALMVAAASERHRLREGALISASSKRSAILASNAAVELREQVAGRVKHGRHRAPKSGAKTPEKPADVLVSAGPVQWYVSLPAAERSSRVLPELPSTERSRKAAALAYEEKAPPRSVYETPAATPALPTTPDVLVATPDLPTTPPTVQQISAQKVTPAAIPAGPEPAPVALPQTTHVTETSRATAAVVPQTPTAQRKYAEFEVELPKTVTAMPAAPIEPEVAVAPAAVVTPLPTPAPAMPAAKIPLPLPTEQVRPEPTVRPAQASAAPPVPATPSPAAATQPFPFVATPTPQPMTHLGSNPLPIAQPSSQPLNAAQVASGLPIPSSALSAAGGLLHAPSAPTANEGTVQVPRPLEPVAVPPSRHALGQKSSYPGPVQSGRRSSRVRTATELPTPATETPNPRAMALPVQPPSSVESDDDKSQKSVPADKSTDRMPSSPGEIRI